MRGLILPGLVGEAFSILKPVWYLFGSIPVILQRIDSDLWAGAGNAALK
jgi:hypothetical protein